MSSGRESGGGICASCHNVRPLDELTAFWPVGDPQRFRYVCRPSAERKTADPFPCFAKVVGSAIQHELMLASKFRVAVDGAVKVIKRQERELRHGPSRGLDLRQYIAVPA